jgi:flagellar biosynthesis component FlhA
MVRPPSPCWALSHRCHTCATNIRYVTANRFAWVVVVLLGLTAVSSILASIFGAQAILLAVWSLVFTVVAFYGASKLQARENHMREAELLQRRQEAELVRRKREKERQHQQELERRRSIREGLDHDCAVILGRAEQAVKGILASDARAQGLLDPPVDEKLLREHVEAIFVVGQKITDFRAAHGSIIAMNSPKAKMPSQRDLFGRNVRHPRLEVNKDMTGPMTAAVIEAQQRALGMAIKAAESRTLNLEHYASAVEEVDATYRDFVGAQRAERLNDPVRDLLANTVRDELAAEELKRLTERAAAAEQAFRHSIHEANLAAEILALPDDKKS